MPHLSQLQRDYQDKHVTIIGLTSEDPGNTLEDVKEMVADKGDVMGYTVAWDVERETNESLRPLDPTAAKWKQAEDEPGRARVVLQMVQSSVGVPPLEIGDPRDFDKRP